ncbi:DUF503 domain-containing protein [Thermodesulfobacteriota bacterium]
MLIRCVIMFVAVVSVDIKIGNDRSLKGKRKVLRGILDRLKSKFNASVAEISHHDLWQRTMIGVSIVSNDKAHANSSVDKVMNFLYAIPDINIINTTIEIIGF